MDEYLSFAKKLAIYAGKIIRTNFTGNITVESKSDNSPVTNIDREINKYVIQQIKQTYPEHGLLGEESNFGTGTEKYIWLCDPIDGTVPFVLNVPMSVFMLSLLVDGEPSISVVHDPFQRKLFHAVKDGGAFCNNKSISVNNNTIKNGYVLLGTSSYPFIKSIKKKGGRVEPFPGTGYKCMMIASGKGIGQIKQTADFHDVGPASLIIKEAGGKVTDFKGSNQRYDDEIGGTIISNGIAHQELLEIANENS